MQDKLIPLCKLYEKISRTTGRRYFVGNWSMTSKVLVFHNDDAKEGDPQWTLFVTEREAKPQALAEAKPQALVDDIPDPGEPIRTRKRRPYEQQREF